MHRNQLMFTLILCVASSVWSATNIIPDSDPTNKLIVYVNQGKDRIAPEIYGQFAEHLGRCVYEGFWVGQDSDIPNVRGIRTDVVEALKRMKVPVLRWPGGCFADEYHWKEGVGPREKRGKMINTHCDRVKMANIAQINNVLQAMILTRGKEMIVTPTYHVFEMFNVHQGATFLPSDLYCHQSTQAGQEVPGLVIS